MFEIAQLYIHGLEFFLHPLKASVSCAVVNVPDFLVRRFDREGMLGLMIPWEAGVARAGVDRMFKKHVSFPTCSSIWRSRSALSSGELGRSSRVWYESLCHLAIMPLTSFV